VVDLLDDDAFVIVSFLAYTAELVCNECRSQYKNWKDDFRWQLSIKGNQTSILSWSTREARSIIRAVSDAHSFL
jgi:hypothetical protein